MSGKYHYWDANHLNKDGETLEECDKKYGRGKQTVKPGIIMEVIFLSKKRDFGYSWCLKCYHKQTGQNVPVTAYEQDKVYE